MQAELDIIASGDDVMAKQLPALSGTMSVDEALHKLLAGSGLTYVYQGERAVTITTSNSRPRWHRSECPAIYGLMSCLTDAQACKQNTTTVGPI